MERKPTITAGFGDLPTELGLETLGKVNAAAAFKYGVEVHGQRMNPVTVGKLAQAFNEALNSLLRLGDIISVLLHLMVIRGCGGLVVHDGILSAWAVEPLF
jgi:hypothetical protein